LVMCAVVLTLEIKMKRGTFPVGAKTRQKFIG
jgi:hypothetical protein